MEIKIMTFNVLNGWNNVNIGTRDDLAASVVVEKRPDIIGFQEFDDCYRLAENPLPMLISKHYDEAGEARTTWNPIFYNKDRFHLLDCGEIPFKKGTVYEYPRGGLSGFRTVSYALLEEKESQERLLVFNLHYDMNKNWQITVENQADESQQVISLANNMLEKFETESLLVTGDYNSLIDGIPCVEMLKNGFIDTRDIALEKDDIGTCAKLGDSLGGDYKSAAIDHVFFKGNKELRVIKYETVDSIRDASDHAPVVVTVEIN